MIRLAAVLVLAVLPCVLRAADGAVDVQRLFLRGLEQFDAARTPSDYRIAAQTWESILDTGYENGAVRMNAGNARLRAGEVGRAIAHYRQARLFRPRDPFLDANLRQALETAPGRLATPPEPWWTPVLFWSGTLSYPEKMYTAAALASAAAVLWLAGFALRRRGFHAAAIAAAVLALPLTADAAVTHAAATDASRAVVVAESIARKGPGEQFEPAFTQPLRDGAELRMLDRRGPWVLVDAPGAGSGWLRREQLVTVLPDRPQ